VSEAKVPSTAEISRLLREANAVRFGEFTLASGAKSDVYIDVKKAWTDPARLERLAEALAAHVRPTDRLAGMELGAVPLVVATALKTGRPYVIIRKAVKEHGTRQRYEGEIPPGAEVLLIEDVATTGGSAAESVEVLRSAGAKVERAIAVVDRETGASAKLGQLGVQFVALVTLSQLREARA